MHLQVVCQRLVGRRRVQTVRPEALVEGGHHEDGRAVENGTRDAVHLLDGDRAHPEVAAHPVGAHLDPEPVQERVVGRPQVRVGDREVQRAAGAAPHRGDLAVSVVRRRRDRYAVPDPLRLDCETVVGQVGDELQRADVVPGDRFHPHRLPDAGTGRVPDAARIQPLLADGRVGTARAVGRVVHADDQLLGAAGQQRVRDIGAEPVVTATVFGDPVAVDVHLGLPVHGLEVELQPCAGADVPVGGNGEGTPVPHPILVPLEPGELRLHRVGDEDPLGQRPADGRLLAGLGGGELPAAVEVAPGIPGQLGAGVLRQRVVRPHLVGPPGAQFVAGGVGSAAVEGADNVAVTRSEAALAVVADVGPAAGGTGLVADHRLLERDEQRVRIGRVEARRAERPVGAADHGPQVGGEVRGRRGRRMRELQFQGASVSEDRGAGGAVVIEAVGQEERRLRDGLLGAAGLGPADVEVGTAEVLEVLDLEVVGRAGRQIDGGGGLFTVPVVDPVVDRELAADPQAEAVVPGDREGVRSAPLRHQLAGPADTDVVRPARGERQARFEVVEVEVLVEAGGLQLAEVEGARRGLCVVLALQAVNLCGFPGRGARVRGGDEACRPKGRGQQKGEPLSESSGAHGSSSDAGGGARVSVATRLWCGGRAASTTLSRTALSMTTRIPISVQRPGGCARQNGVPATSGPGAAVDGRRVCVPPGGHPPGMTVDEVGAVGVEEPEPQVTWCGTQSAGRGDRREIHRSPPRTPWHGVSAR